MNAVETVRGCRCVLLALCLCWAAPLTAGEGAAPQGAEGNAASAGPGGRLQSVRALIEESSAARRVESSSHAQAKALREKARDLHRQAAAAQQSGDKARAEDLLSQAAKQMFEAVKLLDAGAGTQDKKQHDYDARLESVNALTAALERICVEKQCDAAMRAEVRRTVDDKVKRAQALRAKGDIDGARAALDQAYVAVKVAIEHQRSGDTLVRSLQFKNKKEEYVYEVDRNDTHRMLVTLLLQDKTRDKPGAALQTALEAASRLRGQAEADAAAGNYEAAVQSLEASTREFQRAIRGAGIYIPG